MKNKTKILALLAVLVIVQGCSTTMNIKSQTSAIKEIASCISDRSSRGQCKDADAVSLVTETEKRVDYFESLVKISLPDSMETYDNLIRSKNGVVLNNSFQAWFIKNEYNELGCQSSYTKDTASIAYKAINSDTNKSIHALFKVQTSKLNSKINEVEFDNNNFNDFINDLGQSHSYGGLSSLSCAAIDGVYSAETVEDQVSLVELVKELSYTREYLKAYFRNGKFIKGTVKVSELYSRIKDNISKEATFLNESQVENLAKKTFKELTGKKYDTACSSGTDCTIDFAGKLESIQFVSRSGVEYGFPHITVSVDPFSDKKIEVTEVDWNTIGAQIVKVYVEAVGDHYMNLPSDPRSTLCKLDKSTCYDKNLFGVDEDSFSKISEHADKVETVVASAVGKAIRGLSWFSLNNEAIAKVIETSVGATAKKVAEKVAYCTYSCKSMNSCILNNSQGVLLRNIIIKVSK